VSCLLPNLIGVSLDKTNHSIVCITWSVACCVC
jgi:hypothetical protein